MHLKLQKTEMVKSYNNFIYYHEAVKLTSDSYYWDHFSLHYVLQCILWDVEVSGLCTHPCTHWSIKVRLVNMSNYVTGVIFTRTFPVTLLVDNLHLPWIDKIPYLKCFENKNGIADLHEMVLLIYITRITPYIPRLPTMQAFRTNLLLELLYKHMLLNLLAPK